MPLDTMFVVAFVLFMFGAFATTIAWADLQTKSQSHVNDAPKPKRRAF